MKEILSSGDPREPDLSFSHASFKLRWAEQHFQNLEKMVSNLIQNFHDAGSITLDERNGWMAVQNNAIPYWLPLAAGDIIFSLRSSLDCCWTGLKRARDANAEKDTLPRANDRAGVLGKLKSRSVENAFEGSDEFIVDQIRPYKDGREALWFIAQIDNWNKHNMLILTAQKTTVSESLITGTTANGGRISISCINNSYIGGEPMKIFDFGPGAKLNHYYRNVDIEIVLSRNDPFDGRSLMPFIQLALNETREVIQMFSDRFSKVKAL